MNIHLLSSVQAAVPDPSSEPLWRIIVRDIPLGPDAIVLYVLIGFSLWLLWWGNRTSSARAAQKLAERNAADTGDAAQRASPGASSPARSVPNAGRGKTPKRPDKAA